MATKRILCLWLPDWSSQRRANATTASSLADRDLSAASLPRPAENGSHGQPMATEILDRMADREALQALAVACERFSPTVGVEAAADPECLFFDISGVAHLFGGEAALTEQVVGDFTWQGLTVRVAVADTLGAAWAVAHHTTAVAIIRAGEGEAALRPLPVAALRLADEALGLLRQLGIERIEQLLALPRCELTVRFGPQLLQRLDQATGQLAEPVPERKPRPRFHAHWAFDPPTVRRETVEQVLDRLLMQVTAMLACRGCGVLRLECWLNCPPQKPLRVGFGLFEPTVAVKHLSELMRLQLERLRLVTPITAIDAEATVTAPLERRQQELFADDSPRSRPRQLAGLIDRLSTRLGREAVVRVRLKPDAQPELAWQCEPLVDQGARSRRRSPSAPAGWPPRPLQLLPHPLRLSAMSLSSDGVFPGGPPVQFSFHGCQHHVAHAWGPERIETGWWRGQTVGRDYFHVETSTGCRFWLFRRLRDGQWFLHGTFD
jgi:protein ImuB